MTRRQFIASTLLRVVYGLALSIGIAWFFSLAQYHRWGPVTNLEPPRWPVSVPDDWPKSPTRCEVASQIGSTSYYASTVSREFEPQSDHAAKTRSDYNVSAGSSGWPFRCMQSESRQVMREVDGIPTANEYTRVDVPFAPLMAYADVPLRPLFPGLMANTAFYAALLGFAAWLTYRLRTWLRTRKGLCPECKYPFGVSPCCTECGRDISRWSKIAPTSETRPT